MLDPRPPAPAHPPHRASRMTPSHFKKFRLASAHPLEGTRVALSFADGAAFELDLAPDLSSLSGPLTELAAGDAIGPYRLIGELGAGGMGAVWLAERSDGALKR